MINLKWIKKTHLNFFKSFKMADTIGVFGSLLRVISPIDFVIFGVVIGIEIISSLVSISFFKAYGNMEAHSPVFT